MTQSLEPGGQHDAAGSEAKSELVIARRIRAQALVTGRPAAAVAADIHDACEPTFGTTWIRAYRLAHGIALTDVVEQVRAWFEHEGRNPPRFSETLLSAYESAQKRPGPEYLHYLCSVYRANPDDLGYPGRCLCGRSHRVPGAAATARDGHPAAGTAPLSGSVSGPANTASVHASGPVATRPATDDAAEGPAAPGRAASAHAGNEPVAAGPATSGISAASAPTAGAPSPSAGPAGFAVSGTPAAETTATTATVNSATAATVNSAAATTDPTAASAERAAGSATAATAATASGSLGSAGTTSAAGFPSVATGEGEPARFQPDAGDRRVAALAEVANALGAMPGGIPLSALGGAPGGTQAGVAGGPLASTPAAGPAITGGTLAGGAGVSGDAVTGTSSAGTAAGTSGAAVADTATTGYPPPSRSAADDDDVLRRTLMEVMAGSLRGLGSRFFGAVDGVRRRMDDALLRGSVSATMMDQWEETAAGYGRQYMTVPPLRVLCDVLLDLGEVRRMCEERQQIEFQDRLCRVAAQLAALTGMIMIDLGDQRLARSFFRTARIAADETGDRCLRAWVTVRESLVPLYYGDPREAVMLANASADLAGRNTCVANAMAPLVEARALARLAGPGRATSDRARRMIARAHAAFDQLGQDQRADTAFGYTVRQLLFHEGNALAALGAEEADRVLAGALSRYPAIEYLDRSLISFDQAICKLSAGDVEEALHIGEQTISRLPADHRPEIVFQRARDLGHAAAGKAGQIPAVRMYQQAIAGR